MAKKVTEKRRMMIEINGVTYPLRFGIKFLKEINNEEDGLTLALAGLLEGDSLEVYRLLKAATNTQDDITDEQLADYFEQETDIEKLVEDFLLILPAMNTTKIAVKRLLPRLKKLQKKKAEMEELTLKAVENEMQKARDEMNE